MVYHMNVQKINFKYLIFGATQKWQNYWSKYAYFQIYLKYFVIFG